MLFDGKQVPNPIMGKINDWSMCHNDKTGGLTTRYKFIRVIVLGIQLVKHSPDQCIRTSGRMPLMGCDQFPQRVHSIQPISRFQGDSWPTIKLRCCRATCNIMSYWPPQKKKFMRPTWGLSGALELCYQGQYRAIQGKETWHSFQPTNRAQDDG